MSVLGRQCQSPGILQYHQCGWPSFMTSRYPILVTCTRNKTRGKRSKSKSGPTEEEVSDEDDDDDVELKSGNDFRDIRTKVSSLRMDAILKAGLGISRNKVQEAFYGSKLRINGQRMLKKGQQLHEGDEIDVIKAPCDLNPNLLNISRVVILKVGKYDEDSDKVMVILRKYSQLLVEMYHDYKTGDD